MVESAHRQAAQWWVRLGRDDPRAADRAIFERWLEASPDNAAAWRDVSMAWSITGAMADTPVAQVKARRPLWGPRTWGALAASLVLAVATVVAVQGGWLRSADKPSAPVAITTPVGEMRTVRLADGSTVTLDADSAIQANMTDASRDLRLTRGRAHFEVAHDAARPFRVAAGGVTVEATGTSFDINHLRDGVEVTLLRGGVDVRSGRAVLRLQPGQHLAVVPGLPLTPTRVDAGEAEGWVRGELYFHDAQLSDIAAQMNRYGGRRLVIADPQLARARFSGVFNAGDAPALADALRAAGVAKHIADRGPDIVIGSAQER